MSYPRFQLARSFKRAQRTSGNITLNQTAATDVDAGLDLILAAQVGDLIEYGISGRTDATASDVGFDVYTWVAGAPVSSFGPGLTTGLAAAAGVPHWYAPASAFRSIEGPMLGPPLIAGDLSGGLVTLRLRYAKSAATAKTLNADAATPLTVWAKNLGPADPN